MIACYFYLIFSSKHGPSFNKPKTYIGVSKLYLIIFALKSIYIIHITQPLLSFKAVHPTSEDVQVEEIKGERFIKYVGVLNLLELDPSDHIKEISFKLRSKK